MDNVIIIGGGHASIQCAMKLREYNFTGKITILTEEKFFPYHRPPLSKKFLTGAVSEEDLYIVNPQTIKEKQIDIQFETKVAAVNTDQVQVLTDRGVFHYDKLIVATGASPRKLLIDNHDQIQNLRYCRNIDDVNKIAAYLDQIHDVVIIGGGYIGLELAATLKLLGKNVTLLEKSNRILQRVASEATSNFIKAEHLANGVVIKEGLGVQEFIISSNQINQVILENGEVFNTDLVIAGIGVIPNTQFLDNRFLKLNDSLVVNEFCLTNKENVYAIGDCTIFKLENLDTKLESVQNANEQADIAAKHICGNHCVYTPKPWFWSDQYNLKIQIAGLARNYNLVLERKTEGKASYWYFKDKTLIAVDAINDPRSFMVGKKFVGFEASDLTQISNPSADLTKIFN